MGFSVTRLPAQRFWIGVLTMFTGVYGVLVGGLILRWFADGHRFDLLPVVAGGLSFAALWRAVLGKRRSDPA